MDPGFLVSTTALTVVADVSRTVAVPDDDDERCRPICLLFVCMHVCCALRAVLKAKRTGDKEADAKGCGCCTQET